MTTQNDIKIAGKPGLAIVSKPVQAHIIHVPKGYETREGYTKATRGEWRMLGVNWEEETWEAFSYRMPRTYE